MTAPVGITRWGGGESIYSRKRAQMIRFYGILFLSSSAAAAAIFWHFFGRSLHYVVGYSEEGGWTEGFTTSTRVGITIAVGLLLGSLLTWLVYAYRHDRFSAASRNRESKPMA